MCCTVATRQALDNLCSNSFPISYIYFTLFYFLPTADMPQVGPRSLYFDVTGEARGEKVKLPSCIRSSKPGALPNTQVCTTPRPPPAHLSFCF